MKVHPQRQTPSVNLGHCHLWKQVGAAIAYYAAAQFSIAFATLPDAASTPIWIASGVAVGVMLLWGYTLWVGIFVSIFVLEFTLFKGWTGSGLFLTLAVTAITTFGKVLAVYWTQKLTDGRHILDRSQDVLRFVVVGSCFSHLPVGAICAALVCALGKAPWSAYPTVMLNWWLGDAFGILILAPLIVAWGRDAAQCLHLLKRRSLEGVILVLLVLAVSGIAFSSHYPLEYMLIPLIVWAAFRFQQPGATLLMVATSILAVIGTAQGYGSFVRDSLNESLLLLQSFIGVIALTTLLLCAVLSENEQVRAELRQINATLEHRVHDRTLQLAAAHDQILALNEKLKAENLYMGAKLDVVRQIQQMILPKADELRAIANLDIASFIEAADDVGGDYYDVFETDGVVTIGIGDVTGHGLESGLLMLMTQTAVRTLTELREQDPVRFLDTLNRTLYKNIRRINTHKSLTLAVLTYLEGKLRISGQHEEVIVLRASGEVTRIDTMDLGFPLGLAFEITDLINSIEIELQPGDGIVLYTDGITEAMNASREFYGLERLCTMASRHWQQGAIAVEAAVIADLHLHMAEQKVLDDITLLVVKRSPSA
ncbi:MASE1 domain-containing protein [Neosynechococcus sphagnicola]|uniref:MASE1 domain-containing protein n=1 Tax=Neosynechococcus sphagnicola TaxID=1501145 RepID=UPI00068D04FB|nr:MASE1 domain-containing protein [Neosynechococcus sphagnicola]